MTFALVDLILLFFLSGFIFYGLFFGFVRMLGVFIGTILGAIIASRLYLFVFGIIKPVFFGYDNLGKILVFLILFSLINKLTSYAFLLIEKVLDLMSIIPFLKTINRFAGAILGFVTGSLTIGLVLYFISKYAIIDFFVGMWLHESKLVPIFLFVNKISLPLLPEFLKKTQSMI